VIERRITPILDELQRDYARARRPVVLTDLLDGAPIRELATLAGVRAVLGGLRLRIREHYDEALFETSGAADPSGPTELTLAEYLDFVEEHEGTTRMCMEQDLPPEVEQLAPWPTILSQRRRDGLAMLFVGNRGNYARMHFDADARDVLLYQVAGTKTVIVAPPQAGPRLVPLRNFSMLCLDQMSAADRADLVRYIGGAEHTLEPGEAVLIPALCWHFVDYDTTGISVSYRLGRDERTRALAGLHPTYRSQAVRAELLHAASTPELEREHAGLCAALAADHASPAAMYEVMERAVEEAYARVCRDYFQGTYCVTGLDEMEQALGVAFYRQEAAHRFAPASA
jgi:hypothetical protein